MSHSGAYVKKIESWPKEALRFSSNSICFNIFNLCGFMRSIWIHSPWMACFAINICDMNCYAFEISKAMQVLLKV